MQVVIEIHEKIYKKLAVKREENIPWDYIEKICTAITYGIPLPKGHGELIDRSKLSICPIDITDLPQDKCLMVYLADDVDNAKVIIEADKESEE